MEKLKQKVILGSFLTVMMVGINFTSCKQIRIPETRKNIEAVEDQTTEQNTRSREFIDCIYLLETADFVTHYAVSLGLGPVAYKLDKQNIDFIQLIKDADKRIEPLKVTIDESGYIIKVTKISEIEKKEFMESYKWQSCLDNAETPPKE